MGSLYRFADQMQSEIHKKPIHLFDKESFKTAKALNMAIPGGPKFEPLFDDESEEEDWNDFNDLRKTIIRNPIRTEYKVAFPNLYNDRPRKVEDQPE